MNPLRILGVIEAAKAEELARMTPEEAAARSDAAFDGRTWEGMGRLERQRYIDRATLALRAAKAQEEKVKP